MFGDEAVECCDANDILRWRCREIDSAGEYDEIVYRDIRHNALQGARETAYETYVINVTAVTEPDTVWIVGGVSCVSESAASDVTDEDGVDQAFVTYEWKTGGVNGISIGTGKTYVLTQAEAGEAITVIARYTELQSTPETPDATTATTANAPATRRTWRSMAHRVVLPTVTSPPASCQLVMPPSRMCNVALPASVSFSCAWLARPPLWQTKTTGCHEHPTAAKGCKTPART